MQQNNSAQNQQPRRMTLGNVKRGKIVKPPKVILFGGEGIGKTTWASQAPNPIFLCAEDGTAQLDVARLPEPRNWDDVLDAIGELTTAQHDFKTLVIDSLDWLEPMCWDYVCRRDGYKNIEDYGFSKGQNVIALNEWRALIGCIERMCRTRNMGCIIIAHQQVKTFKNPEGEDYDRYELAVHAKAGGIFKQWADATLFARFEDFANKDQKTKRVRGVSTGARVVHTVRTAAYDAKNRYDLPEVMPLDWQAFADAVAAHTPVDPAVLLARIEQLLVGASDERRAKVNAAVIAANGDAARLAHVADKLSAAVNIKAQETQT